MLALENARKKKRANKDVKQRKELLLERKKKLNRMRQGKTYGLLVWATDELMGTQVHKEVDPALCKKYNYQARGKGAFAMAIRGAELSRSHLEIRASTNDS